MGITSLYSGNKNQFRKYPIKQGMSFQAEDGAVVPDNLIVNCSITTVFGLHRLYIRQIYHSNTLTRITLASVANDLVLGMFYGNVVSDFTTLNFVPFVRNISGSLTIGSSESLGAIINTLHFTKDAAELEESTIFCYTPPAVSSIADKKGSQLRGDVNFGVLTNIKKSNTVAKTTQFTASNPSAVFNMSDKSTYLDNCLNPIIKTINGVVPYPVGGFPRNDGNIYIVGVNPVVFYGIPAAVAVGNMVVGANIAANTIITAGGGSAWTVSVNQLANTAVDAKIYSPVCLASGTINLTNLAGTPANAGLAVGQLITGAGIAANTYIRAYNGTSWTIEPSQSGGSFTVSNITAYEQTWSGKVTTVNNTKDLTIIYTDKTSASVSGAPGTLKVQTSGVSLDSLCAQKHKLLPPVDIWGITTANFPDTYYSKLALGATGAAPARNDSSYYNTTRPEYYFWPQFFKTGYYTAYWNTLS